MPYPIFLLKRQARRRARQDNIPLHQALDDIARREGYQAWSHLASAAKRPPAGEPDNRLRAGELLLIGARPGQGKTLFGLTWAADAVRAGHRASIFSLEETEPSIRARLERLARGDTLESDRLRIDVSDELDADHVISRLDSAQPGDVALIDYLQLLDQNRRSPPLGDQIGRLRALAQAKRIRIACLSQIDRRFDLSGKPMPDYADVRRVDALGAGLFDTALFLHQGKTNRVALPGSR
jgi:replicative DNA helicase